MKWNSKHGELKESWLIRWAILCGGLAALQALVKTRICDELRVKLWRNLSFNPVSALTGQM